MTDGPREVVLDFDRVNRTGIGEAIFCAGKSRAQLIEIVGRVNAADKPMLFTRLTPDEHAALAPDLPDTFDYDPVSQTGFHRPLHEAGRPTGVAVVTGGSADVPVALEASRTLRFYGYRPLDIFDVGVAGLWRVTERLGELRECRVIICVAGMEAALPTVLAGLVRGALIAVPTSVGYGVAAEGHAALHSLLASCAPGLVVVNIDNGYGAACAALRILNQSDD